MKAGEAVRRALPLLAEDAEAVDLLWDFALDADVVLREKFKTKLLAACRKIKPTINGTELWSVFTQVALDSNSAAGKSDSLPPIPATISEAVSAVRAGVSDARKARKALMQQLHFTKWDKHRDLLDHLPHIKLKELSEPYPPLDQWIAETPALHDLWFLDRTEGDLHDDRKRHKQMHLLDHSRIQHVVRSDESQMVRDADTGEWIALVLRNFCPVEAVTAAVDAAVEEQVPLRRDIRVSGFLLALCAGLTGFAVGGHRPHGHHRVFCRSQKQAVL